MIKLKKTVSIAVILALPGGDPVKNSLIILMKTYYVYILSSQRNGTLYIGVTSNLQRRVYEHKNKLVPGFTKRYAIDQLVYFESFSVVYDAIKREKILKKWNRKEKLALIESNNPLWEDLYPLLFGRLDVQEK